MSRRMQRVANLIRQSLGEAVLSKLSDPRIDPARTSVTRVEVAEDLLTAKVFVSVLGTPGEQRRALGALRHAGGHLQELMMRQITLRHTPILSFQLDERYKKTLQTLELIQQAMDEIDKKAHPEREQAELPAGADAPSRQDEPSGQAPSGGPGGDGS